MADPIKLNQKVSAFYEAETNYGAPADATLSHIGLLDTFDPKMVEMQYAGVPSLGQSTDPFIAAGPVKVTLPLKIGLWGNGWKTLLGRAIGLTTIDSASRPAHLTNDVQTVAIVADEVVTGGTDYNASLITGVSFNEVSLEADYTTAGPMTLNFDAWGYYVNDKQHATRSTARDFGSDDGSSRLNTFITDDYSDASIPADPATDPLTATDLTVYFGTLAATKGITIDGPAGSWVEVGEKYMLFYTSAGALSSGVPAADDDSIVADGVIDLSHANASTITLLSGLADGGWTGWTIAVAGGGGAELSTNLKKGVYSTDTSRDIYAATEAGGTGFTTVWPYLKTVKLTVTNNLTALPGRAVGADSSVKWLQHAACARGKADITLDITAANTDETFYDLLVGDSPVPLVRLDLGANGSIALTNGKIMSRAAPYTAGGEVVETIQLKFTGEGDYGNWSKYAISGDF